MMATGNSGTGEDGVNKDLNKFLQDRTKPNSRVDAIVSKSYARAEIERKHSADADDLSRHEKERKLEQMLQRHGHKRRRKSRLTVSDVRLEAAKILEEFLQSQLLEQSVQTSHEHRYQRYMEMDIAEETTQSGDSTGYLASHSTLNRENSIPYADESDNDTGLRRTAGSLPQDDMLVTMYANKNKPGVEIIHGKSKSVPYKGLDESFLPHPNRKFSGLRPPPPPPPGTPLSPSDCSGSKESLGYVPYTGMVNDLGVHTSSGSSDWLGSQGHVDHPTRIPAPSEPVTGSRTTTSSSSVHSTENVTHPKVPTSLELPATHSHSGSTTPRSGSGSKSSSPEKLLGARNKTGIRVKSGSISSSESDSDQLSHLKDRKKKPFYKKAQERFFNTLIRRQKDHSPDREDTFNSNQQLSKKKQKKKQKKDKKSDNADSFDARGNQETVLEDRYIHINKHIHQTHSGTHGNVVHRTEDSTEVMDIVSDSEKKHIEKRMKVKESSEGGKGFFGRIRRMTSREKGKRKMKGSKSSNFHERGKGSQDIVQYGRGLSVPGQRMEDEDDIHITHVERGSVSPNQSIVKARQIVDRRDDIKRHSSHLDIVDHDGSLVERVFFDAGETDNLPRNQSFDLVENVSVHEREVRENGKVKVIRDVSRHDHMVISDDEGGNNEATGAIGPSLADLTEKEKEDLYGKIAGRLAMIGDNIMTERGDHASQSPSPKTKDSPSPDEEMKKTHLSQLETEIRDELRLVADEIDARLAANARQAAMRIAGVVAYDQFSQVVDEQVNKEVGWAQVAAVFNITKRAIQVAGASGTLAVQIKEMSLKYIEDKFASWIVGQGGWDSMLSGSDTDSDSELD